MKEIKYVWVLEFQNRFISHMVQMKVYNIWEIEKSNTFFISHMVQMKVDDDVLSELEQLPLYIPHGSDESHRQCLKSPKINYFISHMVQMKA